MIYRYRDPSTILLDSAARPSQEADLAARRRAVSPDTKRCSRSEAKGAIFDLGGRAVHNQLGYRLAGGGRIEHAPDIVAGRDIGARRRGPDPSAAGHPRVDRSEARLARDNRRRGERRRETSAQPRGGHERPRRVPPRAGRSAAAGARDRAGPHRAVGAREHSGVSTSPLASRYSRNSASAGTLSPVSKTRLWPLWPYTAGSGSQRVARIDHGPIATTTASPSTAPPLSSTTPRGRRSAADQVGDRALALLGALGPGGAHQAVGEGAAARRSLSSAASRSGR